MPLQASAQAPGPSPSIAFVGWEITRACNLDCPHCLTESLQIRRGVAEDPPLAEVRSILAQLAPEGVVRIGLSGGEPLFRRDLEQIIEYGRELGIPTFDVATNGLLATRRRLTSLKAAGLNKVQVSIDGPDAPSHARIRGCKPKHFELSCQAVAEAVSMDFEVWVACILSRPACHSLHRMVDLARELGAEALRYVTFVPAGRARDVAVARQIAPGPEDLRVFVSHLAEFPGQEADGTDGLPVVMDESFGPTAGRPELRCVAGTGLAHLLANGDVYPCPILCHPPFLVGNLRQQSWGELLRSPRMRRCSGYQRRQLGEPCRRCANGRCQGVCPGLAYAVHGKELAGAPLCHWHEGQRASDPPPLLATGAGPCPGS